MGGAVELVDTSEMASRYAAALVCLRLLRALLASIAAAFALFGLLAVVIVIFMIGAAARGLVLGQSWLTIAPQLAYGVLLINGAMAVLALLGAIYIQVYIRASRGSVPVAWSVLCLAALFLATSCADLVFHLVRVVSLDAASRGAEVVESAQDLWPMYVAVAFLYGSWGIIRGARGEGRTVLFARDGGEDRRARFYGVMGIPMVPGDHRRQLRRAVGLAWSAFACEGFAFTVYFGVSTNQVPSMSLTVAAGFVLLAWLVSIGCLFGLLALSQRLWTLARRAGQPSLQESLALDGRPPVLFLRSFADDQVSLASARVPRYLRVVDPGIVRHRFEELLVSGFGSVGPLIAIGDPRDPRPPIGASRQYFGAGQWQDHVLHHMSGASAIVVSLSNTTALGWELDQIRVRGYVKKTLFIVPPALSGGAREVWMTARRGGWHMDPARVPNEQDGPDQGFPQHILALWSNGPDSGTIVGSSHLSELDYEMAVRLFVARSRS